ncbi:sushi, von Willebrand factor type A, EGF and pentraxin domain-containing protein 1-like [Strongylocentrotus purpuratus]|uniref:Sushi, von Willebrand factor type A, EGF and pentraxin domain-containing protein 1-like n=1 Tax=Strongylocentrotus purpuratus TaxID=7668 RepID=A0A7M7P3V8_STRPU|nr:sushi, von Willebrand factor type A, EGF and pentraxin domain-containing protein 1-like [Strongylocentrotus purpuratus]
MAPLFGQSCVVSCTQQGYQLDPPNFSVLSCQGNGQWAPGELKGTTCKDIQRPSFSTCPPYLTFNPSPGEIMVNISWTLTPEDNSGDEPTVTCNKEQGLTGEGDFEVRCTATDATGNSKTCTFDVAVQVHRCRSYLLPSFAQFAGVCDTIWGAECNITCNPGYHLTGSSTVTCDFDGTTTSWTAQTTPRCEATQCDPLELPEHVNINPSLCAGPDDVSVGTMCTPYCPTGRDLQGDGSSIVCGSDGQWNRFINGSSEDLACLDITAPILTSCPPPITVTRTEAWGVQVWFTPPTATDSLDGSSLIVTTSPSDLTSPYNLTQDTTFIYTFSDNASNPVNCSFPIYVQDELSPVLVSCPNNTEVSTSQQEKEVTWDPPEFLEPTGDPLDISCNYDNGMATLAVDKDHLIECRATNQDNSKTTTCSFIISVKESHSADNLNLPSKLFYFSDSCGTNETQLAIATAFLNAFNSSGFHEICTEECTVNNVQVTCGPSGRRRRKRRSRRRQMDTPVDLGIWEEHLYLQHPFFKIHKRSALNFEIVIGFSLETNLIVGEGQTDFDAALDAEDKMIGLVETLIEDGQLDLSSSVDGFTAVLDESSFNYEYVELVCVPPYTANNDVYRCVPCGSGFYYGNETQECIQCEIGTYQDTHGQFSCHQCPEGQSTIAVGSENVTQCIDICQPGYSSFTGLAPCNHCPIGTYQEEFFATECTSCPVGTTTVNKGSTSSLECIEFCAAGEYSPSGFVPCMACPLGTYQSGIQRSACHQCPGETTTLQKGSTDASMCILMNVRASHAYMMQAALMELIPSHVSVD